MARSFIIIFVLSFSFSALHANAWAQPESLFHETNIYSYHISPLPYFNGIDVGDNIHLVILDSQSGEQKISKAPADRVSAQVEANTLVLRRVVEPALDAKGKPRFNSSLTQRPVTITVWTPRLGLLKASQFAKVKMENVSTCYGINVIANDNAQVILRGTVNLQKLTATGNSQVSVGWIDSYHIKMRSSDQSKITLSGFTCILDAALCHCSHLDASCLRSKQVFIKTTQSACAKVLPIFALYGFAKDYSGIYYYKTPQFITQNSTESGNILQMEYRN